MYERHQSERDHKRHQWEVVLAYGSVRARVAWQLLALAERFGVTSSKGVWVPPPLTQEQLAKLVGAVRQTVLQALKHFYEHRWIERKRKNFWILDYAKLAEQSRESW